MAGAALGAYAITQAAKTVSPTPLNHRGKLGVAFLAATAQAFVQTRNPVDALVRTAIPATGLAVFVHRLGRWAQTASDYAMAEAVKSGAEVGRRRV